MDKIMVTLLLIIAGVVCSVVIINAAFPAITGSTGAITDTASKISDRIRSQVKIIEIASTGNDLYVWIKNVGTSRVLGIEQCDIFFGPEGNFARIPKGTTGSSEPYWEYAIENASNWAPSATIKVTIHYGSALSGSYFYKIVIPNGVSDETIYSTT